MEFEKPVLYKQESHPYYARNVNRLREARHAASGINQKIAVTITRAMGNMFCAYIFAALALAGFPGLHATLPQYVQWVSQTFIQLTALSILAVGQDVLSQHQQIQAEETYQTTEKTFHDAEQMRVHQEAQDAQLIEIHENIQALSVQAARLITLLEKPAPKTAKKTEVVK